MNVWMILAIANLILLWIVVVNYERMVRNLRDELESSIFANTYLSRQVQASISRHPANARLRLVDGE